MIRSEQTPITLWGPCQATPLGQDLRRTRQDAFYLQSELISQLASDCTVQELYGFFFHSPNNPIPPTRLALRQTIRRKTEHPWRI